MADLFETFPKRVKVGSYTFRVELVGPGHDALCEDDVQTADGVTVFEKTAIYVCTGMPLDLTVNTLWHELTHAIDYSYGVNDESTEETVAMQTTNGWMQVNLDNPKLERWFHRAWQELRKTR